MRTKMRTRTKVIISPKIIFLLPPYSNSEFESLFQFRKMKAERFCTLNFFNHNFVNKEVSSCLSGWLFVCPIMNPLTNFPQILIGELGRTTGMFLA